MRELKCTINGTEVTIQISDEDFNKAFAPQIITADKTGYERPAYDETYYCFTGAGTIHPEPWKDTDSDNKMYEIGNCFIGEELAEDTAHRLFFEAKLLRYAREHWDTNEKPYPPEWGSSGYVWHIVCDNDGQVFAAPYNLNDDEPINEIWFDTGDNCRAAIKEFEDDIIKYYFNWSDSDVWI